MLEDAPLFGGTDRPGAVAVISLPLLADKAGADVETGGRDE